MTVEGRATPIAARDRGDEIHASAVSAEIHDNKSWPASSRAAYTAWILGPIGLTYLLPLLMYRIPILVRVYDVIPPFNQQIMMVPASVVAHAVAIGVVWFAVAAGVILLPARLPTTVPRVWTQPLQWRGFLLLSILGAPVAIVHLLVKAPASLEDVVHQIALAPAIAVVLGTSLLQGGAAAACGRRRVFVIRTLVAVCAVTAIVPPILVSQVAPAALSAIAMLYGWNVIGWPRRRQAIVALGLAVVVIIGIPVREMLRETVYGEATHQRITLGGMLPRGRTAPGALLASRVATCKLLQAQIRLPALPGLAGVAECGVEMALDRFNRLSDLAYTVRETPAPVPYAHGTTYRPLMAAFVPRAVWPNKPTDQSGQWYGHRYNFIVPPNLTESTNLSMLAEAWTNDGWFTVVGSALFFGCLLRFIWQGWVGAYAASGNVMIGMAVVRAAADGDSDMSLVVGGIVHALLVYWFLDVLLRAWGTRRHPAARPIE